MPTLVQILLLIYLVAVTVQHATCRRDETDIVTEMYKKRMQHIAEMNYVGVLSINHILDVGTGDGHWTKFTSKMFPSADFFLIDGNPHLRKALEDSGYDFEIAVVGSEQENNRPISYSLQPDGENMKNNGNEGGGRNAAGVGVGAWSRYESESEGYCDESLADTASTTTIDDIAEKRGLSVFQLLRLNLRGEEFEALQGAKRILEEAEFVLLEVPLHQYHAGSAGFTDLNAYLTLRGFRLYDIMDLRYSQPRSDMDVFYQVPTLVQCDVLWAKETSRVFSTTYPSPPSMRTEVAFNESEMKGISTGDHKIEGSKRTKVFMVDGSVASSISTTAKTYSATTTPTGSSNVASSIVAPPAVTSPDREEKGSTQVPSHHHSSASKTFRRKKKM